MVGTVVHPWRFHVRPIVAVVLWTAVLPVLLVVASETVLPEWETTRFVVSMGANVGDRQFRFTYQGRASGWRWPRQRETVRVEESMLIWTDNAGTDFGSAYGDPHSLLWTFHGSGGQPLDEPLKVDREALLTWLADGGLDASDESARTLANDLLALTQLRDMADLLDLSPSIMRRGAIPIGPLVRRVRLVEQVGMPVWIAIWLAGAVLLYLRFRVRLPG